MLERAPCFAPARSSSGLCLRRSRATIRSLLPRRRERGGALSLPTPALQALSGHHSNTSYHDGFSWFPLSRGLSTDASVDGIRRSSALLAELIAWMRNHKKTIGRPIVTGFSQGGALSFALSIAHPELVGAAVPVGGWLPPPLWPDEGSPQRYPEVHALHGADDTRVPVSGAQAVVSRMRKVGRSAHIETFRGVGHSISEEMRKRLFALLEHAARAESR